MRKRIKGQRLYFATVIAVAVLNSRAESADTELLQPDVAWISLKIQSVPRSEHTVSVIQTSQLMLYREIIAVCSEIHTKHINTLCGQNVELFKDPVRTAQ
jgi:hypothetical protein